MTLRLSKAIVMASDAPATMYNKPQGFCVSIAPPSRKDFDLIYKALAHGVESIAMPPGETFWAERFAMFTDR